MRQTRAKLLIGVICAAITVNDVKGTDPNDVKQIRALAASYLVNTESFTELNCDYEIMNYQPVSKEELARGTFRDDIFCGNVPPKATAGGVWIRSGSTVRRELIVDDTALGEAIKTQRIVFSPESVLVDGVDGIALNRLLKGGVLYSRRYRPEFVEHDPFDFGNFTGSEGFWNPGIVLTNRGNLEGRDRGTFARIAAERAARVPIGRAACGCQILSAAWAGATV